jgi:hypothetical protein
MLVGVIAAAVLAVGTIAAVTATVIVSDDRGVRVVQLAPAVEQLPVPAPGHGLPPLRRGHEGRLFGPGFGLRRDLRGCLERHGLGRENRSAPPNLKTMRDALKACRGTLPGPGFRR